MQIEKSKLEDLKKKIHNFNQKLKGLKKNQKIGISIIIMGVVVIITGFIFIPLIDSAKIWSPNFSYEDGQRKLENEYLTIPENILIQNKYDVIITAYFVFWGDYVQGEIIFKHLATNTSFVFNYFLSAGLYVGEVSTSKTFTMIPGRYQISGASQRDELWEHGIIPKGFEWLAYIGFVIPSILIGIKGFQKYIYKEKRSMKKSANAASYYSKQEPMKSFNEKEVKLVNEEKTLSTESKAKFCMGCGTELKASVPKYCPNCGFKLKRD